MLAIHPVCLSPDSSSPFLLFFSLSSLRVLTRLLHYHQNLRLDKHILDPVLVYLKLIIINTVVILDGLRVQQQKLINRVDSETPLVDL